ncbi:MAG: Crp/Fnr family transcriptional regulator [Proteobacteria bacterium]|nr:Crp/Fnr family transcriptional regulator [Pseudomonadota bacterium]
MLQALAPGDRSLIERSCREVPLRLGEILVEAQNAPRNIYFPTRGVVSTIARYRDGSSIEMATIGREGCTGIGVILGGNRELATQLVQAEGTALALPLADFNRLASSLVSFKALLASYAQAFTYQVLISGACNGRHSLNERLARWLLQMQDRASSARMSLTQELLAEMLGVRRQSVTLAAGALQEAGLIAYRRGTVEILDRDALKEAACECYDMVNIIYDQLLPQKN